MHAHRLFLSLIALLLLAATAMAESTRLKVFPLQHRSAEEMIPIVRPLLHPAAGISGSGYKLIIRTTPENLEELEAVIAELDRAPRNLLILVRQGQRVESGRHGAEISGEIGNDNGRVVVGGGQAGNQGTTLETEGANGHARIRVYETGRRQDEDMVQRLRTLEGHWAQIRIGQDIPVGQRTTTHSPGGVSISEGVEYRAVDSGFEVRPRLSGERVTLEVRPFRARPAASGGGVIETQSATTTVSGQLGEWIEIGGQNVELEQSGSGTVYSTRRHTQQSAGIQLKVQLLGE